MVSGRISVPSSTRSTSNADSIPDLPSFHEAEGVPRLGGIIQVRAPVAQWIERRPPEPDRLSVVATRVGSRAKRVEFTL